MGLAFVWLLVWVIHSLAWLRGLMGGSVAVMAIAGMVFGSLPVLGMILRCCLAFGDSFVAGVGDHSFALLRGLIGF